MRIHTFNSNNHRYISLYDAKNADDHLPSSWHLVANTSSTGFFPITQIGVSASVNHQSGSVTWNFDDLIVSTKDFNLVYTTTETHTTTISNIENITNYINSTQGLSLPISAFSILGGLVSTTIFVMLVRKQTIGSHNK